MKNIQDVIRGKEQQLQQIQKELEALKLAAKLLSDDAEPASTSARATAAPVPSAVMRPPATKDSGTYAASAAWDANKPQFP